MRQRTRSSAGSVISLPRIAVKPHSSTQKCICSCALRRARLESAGVSILGVGIRYYCPLKAVLFRFYFRTPAAAVGLSALLAGCVCISPPPPGQHRVPPPPPL